ncbi:3-phosphoglycerate dehydrogenase [Actinomyces sp. Z5]|uniref:D-3-phosphoglycerate dehydrogenase n=1 Tax=Actinomyces succiniciruminis TaxID=1522002 RepID=A0A1L7RN53_9ACTO|nr:MULTISPECIES: phosphoglycerate dehydrogenase [Actinomyces]MBE6474584.1 3-phosphoglycerate dehydrogenase [Actinomyces succiniciruminis]RAX23646.1 3-phosphoglycerate dehydrogenase [Actinomyces sp. Z5]CED90734.1 D-3-phosphoglycerate dehydrogenase [Actinomyces succiniciruminis]
MTKQFRIQTLNAISGAGLSRFPDDRYDVGGNVTEPHALLVRSAKLHDVPIPDSVLAIARAGAGTNNIPVDAMTQRGIPVFNTPGANANAVKELVLAGLFIASRNLIPAARFAHELTGDDAEIARAVEAGKKQFVGFELPGRTLGVIGLGAIGVQVANAALGLGLNVVGFDPGISVEHAWHLSAEVERAESMEEVFRRADILTVHVPLIESTRGLVSTQRIALMKETAVLLNFARAEIVDEAAVVAALDEGTLGGYVCDFPSTAVHKHPKCISLPHLGASTKEAERNCAVMAVDELRGFLEDGQVHNAVNFPEAVLPREPGTRRLVIVNQNVPNMVGQVSTLVAERGQNIANLLNRSRGDLAVTLVDVEGELGEDVLEQLRAIDGVLSARALEPAA